MKLVKNSFLFVVALITLGGSTNGRVIKKRDTVDEGLAEYDVQSIINAGIGVAPACQTETSAVSALVSSCPDASNIIPCVCASANLQTIGALYTCTVNNGVSVLFSADSQYQDLVNTICAGGGSASTTGSQGSASPVSSIAISPSSSSSSSSTSLHGAASVASSTPAVIAHTTTTPSRQTSSAKGPAVTITVTTVSGSTSAGNGTSSTSTSAGSSSTTTAAKQGGATLIGVTGFTIGSMLFSFWLITVNLI